MVDSVVWLCERDQWWVEFEPQVTGALEVSMAAGFCTSVGQVSAASRQPLSHALADRRDRCMRKIIALFGFKPDELTNGPAPHTHLVKEVALSAILREEASATAYCGQGAGTNLTAVYSLDMSKTAVISLDEAVRCEIRRELAVAGAKLGNSWEVQSIVNSWDRETLAAIRLFNRTGSMFADVICSIH